MQRHHIHAALAPRGALIRAKDSHSNTNRHPLSCVWKDAERECADHRAEATDEGPRPLADVAHAMHRAATASAMVFTTGGHHALGGQQRHGSSSSNRLAMRRHGSSHSSLTVGSCSAVARAVC